MEDIQRQKKLIIDHSSVLESLVGHPKYKRELADELDVSKSTVYNIHTRLADVGLMTKRHGKYALTDKGWICLLVYRGFEKQIETIYASETNLFESAISHQ